MTIEIGARVFLTKRYTRGRDMESFLAGERGTVTAISGDVADVRMDMDDFVYPLPKRVLAQSVGK